MSPAPPSRTQSPAEHSGTRGRRRSRSSKLNASEVESMSPRQIKLIDFDFAEMCEQNAANPSEAAKHIYGTDGYIAPEQYLGQECQKSDVFSVGVILYVL